MSRARQCSCCCPRLRGTPSRDDPTAHLLCEGSIHLVPIISAQDQFAVLLRARAFAGPAAESAVEHFNKAHMHRTLAADDNFNVKLLARPQRMGRLRRALNQARVARIAVRRWRVRHVEVDFPSAVLWTATGQARATETRELRLCELGTKRLHNDRNPCPCAHRVG
jgi:hypothetical protein